MSVQSGTSPGAIISAGNTAAPGGVTSVFGRAGAVIAVSGDYTSSLVTNASAVAGATVTDALNTLLAADTGFVPTSRTLTAGAGLTGGGDLSANRTFDVVANADGSIIVNANDIQVGVLATDAQHGVRGGGTQHALVIAAGAAGFMSGADKTKLDGISPGAGVTSVFGRTGAVVAVNGDYTSSLVTNLSTVTGATVTDALNTLLAADTLTTWKKAVRVATTANITLSGAQTIDGVPAIADDRVLVKNQTSGQDNGIYVVAAGAWSRSTDADISSEVLSGMQVRVTEGTLNGGAVFAITTVNPIVLGTTVLVFSSQQLVSFVNSTVTLSEATAAVTLENPTGTQSQTVYTFANAVKAGFRVDSSGNFSLHANTNAYNGWYSSLDISVPDGNIRSTGMLIGGAAGAASTAKIQVVGAIITTPVASFKCANNQSADVLQCESNGGTADLFAVGFSGIVRHSTTAGITASTTQTQGQGALTKDINQVSTVANINDVVTLPTAAAGMKITIINSGALTLQVFPASGDNLGAGLNASTTQLTTITNTYIAYDATNWVKT